MSFKKRKFVSIFAALLLAACVTTELSPEDKASIVGGDKGGLVAEFDIPRSCGNWYVKFKNLDTNKTVLINYYMKISLLSVGPDEGPRIVTLPAGSYMPISANCTYTEQNYSGGQSQVNYNMTFDKAYSKPVEIVPEKITYPGTYKFVSTRGDDIYLYINERQKIEDYVKTNYPDLFDKLVFTLK